jgi:hypothetical protein
MAAKILSIPTGVESNATVPCQYSDNVAFEIKRLLPCSTISAT